MLIVKKPQGREATVHHYRANFDLLQLINRKDFSELVKKWEMDKYVRTFPTWEQVRILILCYIMKIDSAREVALTFGVPKSTFCDANQERCSGFFEELCRHILWKIYENVKDKKVRRGLKNLLAIDSTECSAHGSLGKFFLWGAKANPKKASVKLHVVWDVNGEWIDDFRITPGRSSVLLAKHQFSTNTLTVFTEQNNLQAKKLLKAYASTYLSEEIKAEALTKNLEGFTRFLFHIAADATKYLDLSKVSKNIAVPRQTVQRYFEILEDTLIIKRLDAFTKSEKRRFIQRPRFYFFDNGVLNSLLGNFICSQDRKGPLFENLFFNQLSTSLSYSNKEYRLSSYRTDAGAEVDIVLELDGEVYALEVKTGEVKKSELLGFQSLEKFLGKKVHRFVITSGIKHAKMDSMEVIPWQKFLQRLGI